MPFRTEQMSDAANWIPERDNWVAHASRVLAIASRNRGLPLFFYWKEKIVSARRRNQHARRVRYPENRHRVCDSVYRASRYSCSQPEIHQLDSGREIDVFIADNKIQRAAGGR